MSPHRVIFTHGGFEMIWLWITLVNDGMETEYRMKSPTTYATIEECQAKTEEWTTVGPVYNEAGVRLDVVLVCREENAPTGK